MRGYFSNGQASKKRTEFSEGWAKKKNQQKNSTSKKYVYYVQSNWIRGLHGPDFSVQARPGPHGYNLGPARPEAKKKVSARARPGP